MNSPESVLYIGSLDKRSNSFRRFEAMSNIAYRIRGFNTDPFIMAKFIAGIQHYYNIGIGILLFNKKIRKLIRKKTFDIVWVDNKSYLSATSLKYIKKYSPQTVIVNLVTDDPFGKYRKSWRMISQTAGLYDHIFVQREVNVEELYAIGAKRVSICYRSFAPDYNRPLSREECAKEFRVNIGFVGTYEKERAEYIAFLIENGVEVCVRGDKWPENEYWDIIKPHYLGPSVYGEQYIQAINGMNIALHFLRHANRDVQDSRTFEIPASNVFMLAEYSEVHGNLFKEDAEAVFFRTKEELLTKVKFYNDNEQARSAIAQRGYDRAIESGYDHFNTLSKAVSKIGLDKRTDV